MWVEVLIRCHFEKCKIVVNLSQASIATEILPQSAELHGFLGVVKSLHLTLLVYVLRSLSDDLFFITVVALFLVLEALHDIVVSLFSGLVGFERFHQLISACNRLMHRSPHRLGLVHIWVFLWDLHSLDDMLLGQNVLVLLCQLEHLVTQFLLRTLILLKGSNLVLLREELGQDVRVASDIVHIRWELRLPVVQ